MGRPLLGRSARNVVLATKGTETEKEALIAKYGSVYEGMRHALMLALASKDTETWTGVPLHPDSTRKGKEEVSAFGQINKVIELGPALSPPVESIKFTHRHKRGKTIGEVYVQGIKKTQYQCAVEGCKEVLG